MHDLNNSAIRSAWETLSAALDFDNGNQQVRWSEEVERRLKENGLTYQAHTSRDYESRQGQLDVVPYLMDESTYELLALGLSQRVRFFEALLADLYGERRLIADGSIPAELLFANPEYLIEVHGLNPNSPWISFLAHDLVRDSEGQWFVLGQSTRAPAGLGYVLERRMIMSRVMGYLLRRMSVKRLSGFFRTLRSFLRADSRDNDLSILLTPGHTVESYFEHAFLANHLDFTLAEGDDLTVRGNRLMLKTLSGLRPVSGVLRRVVDKDLDPLELNPQSRHGIPGLMEVVRSGGVRMGNVPGSGVIDSPLWMGRFDGLCQKLLGEELILKSIPALWFGDSDEHEECFSLWPNLLVRHAGAYPTSESFVVHDLEPIEQARLRARIEADPCGWVAWAAIDLERVPVANGSVRDESHAVIRMYTAQSQDKKIDVMPGGLAACNHSAAWAQLRPNTPEQYKDIWVMGAEPDTQLSIFAEMDVFVIGSNDQSMTPSRVADAMFWLGRYIERADALTRLVREVLAGVIDVRTEKQQAAHWLLGAQINTEDITLEDAAFDIHQAFFVRDAPGGFSELIDAIMRNARATPDYLSDDSWRALVNLEQMINRIAWMKRSDAGRLLDQVDLILMQLAAVSGLNNDTMSRTYANCFMDIGRHLERASKTLILLNYAFQSLKPQDVSQWEMVLEVTDTVMTYRRRYRTRLHPTAILDLLLLDADTPRSISYLAARLEKLVNTLPVQQLGSRKTQLQQTAFAIHANLQMAAIDNYMTTQGSAKRPLIENLDQMIEQLAGLGEAITLAYFSHADVPQHLVKVGR
ncbi:circularly permuted type 2 ATP-grasp protein [Litorivicinus sp.]|nr:circularly permuted type 2 ATP-grasp protein [Litorivicinus sp.]MDC1239850.1 circularly permuted type 2 ATP-grasp protein [Litorivicinus sp.]